MSKQTEQLLQAKNNELETELALKNRELEIEAALERVRSRTMGMHKSEELQYLVSVVFEQLQQLDFEIKDGAAFVGTLTDKSEAFDLWMEDKITQKSSCFRIPHYDAPSINDIFETWNKGDDFISDIYGEEKNIWFKYAFKNTDFKIVPEERKKWILNQSHLTQAIAFQKSSVIGVHVHKAITLSENEIDILKRFSEVFEQGYIRFLDLKKAEEQARKAQIEAALERVRSRTMAMHNSEELSDVAAILFEQLKLLGAKLWSCGFAICKKDEVMVEKWMSSPIAGQTLDHLFIPYNADPGQQRMYDTWKNNIELYSYIHEGKELKDIYDHLMTIPSFNTNFQKVIDSGRPLPVWQKNHVASYKYGYLLIITEEEFEEEYIFPRFTKVFEQTYTRFLDLQKAEAQTREAQIEAGLERIRSRAMGMQKSSELQEVINRIFVEMTELGVSMDSSYIITHLDDDMSKGFSTWVSIHDQSYATQLFQAYVDHPLVHRFYKAWNEKESHFAATFSKEEKNSYFRYQFKHSPQLSQIPEQRKKIILEGNGWSLSWAILKNAAIIIQRYQNIPFGEEEIIIQKRFAKVFEQTYTRFLDLQRAESQARDAVKQASLDRVRGEIASMRNANDLKRITPLIWKELTAMEIPFIRCGVFIMNNEQKIIQTYLSTPDGKSLGIFELSKDAEEIATGAFNGWEKQKIYQTHWDKREFRRFMKNLINSGKVENEETFQGTAAPPESLHLNFVPFKQGMLYVGNTTPLSGDALDLVKSLAEAFSIAYSRYEDFVHLEKAKIQTENTLNDLKAAQNQLIHAEKMASLGELTAGIAHEIQNPLNFVNNFSELNSELIDEANEELDNKNLEEVKLILNDLKVNEQKINHHGKRAESIVKGMLLHSRGSSGKTEPTNINALCDEYLRLSYHGFRAKEKSCNADFKLELEEELPKISIVHQEIGRVLLNLINNAFYAVADKGRQGQKDYKPLVEVQTRKLKDKIEIRIKDNGNGIPDSIKGKIFQPFFSTKPTGAGTGLGLSISYDIITKGHNGSLKVNSEEGHGTEFIIEIPITS